MRIEFNRMFEALNGLPQTFGSSSCCVIAPCCVELARLFVFTGLSVRSWSGDLRRHRFWTFANSIGVGALGSLLDHSLAINRRVSGQSKQFFKSRFTAQRIKLRLDA